MPSELRAPGPLMHVSMYKAGGVIHSPADQPVQQQQPWQCCHDHQHRIMSAMACRARTHSVREDCRAALDLIAPPARNHKQEGGGGREERRAGISARHEDQKDGLTQGRLSNLRQNMNTRMCCVPVCCCAVPCCAVQCCAVHMCTQARHSHLHTPTNVAMERQTNTQAGRQAAQTPLKHSMHVKVVNNTRVARLPPLPGGVPLSQEGRKEGSRGWQEPGGPFSKAGAVLAAVQSVQATLG